MGSGTYGGKEIIQYAGGRDDSNTVLFWGTGLPWSDPHLYALDNLTDQKFSVPDAGLGEYGKVVAKIVWGKKKKEGESPPLLRYLVEFTHEWFQFIGSFL